MIYRKVALESAVIMACYLMLSIGFASAVEVRLVSGGVEYGNVQSSDFDTSALVERGISTDSYPDIVITVKNKTQDYQIAKVYIYACRGMTPDQCVSSGSMQGFEGNVNTTYQWNDLADQTSGYPQKANIMIVVGLQKLGVVTWVSYWHTVTRTSDSVFQQTNYPTLGTLDFELQSAGLVNSVIDYIKSRKMLPFRWAKSVAFSIGNVLYEIASDDMETPVLSGGQKSGNQIDELETEYGFVFPNFPDVSGIMDAVTFYSNPGYVCGNDECETLEGEDGSSCCLDCGCSGAGYYCDIGTGCRLLSQVGLSLYGTPQTAVQNCSEEQVLNIKVEAENMPTGSVISSVEYVLGGGSPQNATCELYSGSVYNCKIAVPPADPCVAGDFKLSGNSITFTIRYNDGSVEKTMERSVSFPDIVVGSWVCGDLKCDAGLGESNSVCCYDCGCHSGYCNYDPGDKAAGKCVEDPVNSDLKVTALNPSYFSYSDGSESVSFTYQIHNRPLDMSVTSQSCEVKCTDEAGNECDAECALSCSRVASDEGSVYNASCTYRFDIQGYDENTGYSLYNVLHVSIDYQNGSAGTLTKTMERSFGIGIGPNYCGDKNCDPSETTSACCWDCGCPDGKYCDSESTEYASSGDMCRDLSDIEFVVDKIDPEPYGGVFRFESSYHEHVINVKAHINNLPAGYDRYDPVGYSCAFGSDAVACYADCDYNESSGSLGLDCNLTIPEIDYRDSAYEEIYDAGGKKILLGPVNFSVVLFFNNGQEKDFTKTFADNNLGEAEIGVEWMCGNGDCESSVGENASNCCLDCPCEDSGSYGEEYFCHAGETVPDGICVKANAIDIFIDSYSPDPAACSMRTLSHNCKFRQTELNISMINAPQDVEIVDAYYSFSPSGEIVSANDRGDKNIRQYCSKTGDNRFKCGVVFPTLISTQEGSGTTRVSLTFSINYTLAGAEITQNVSATTTIVINKTRSTALMSCEEELNLMDRQIKAVKGRQNTLNAFGALAVAISIILFYMFLTCEASSWYSFAYCKSVFLTASVSFMTLAIGLFMQASGLDVQIKSLQAEKAAKEKMCESGTYMEYASSTYSIHGAFSGMR